MFGWKLIGYIQQLRNQIMTRWARNETEFVMSVITNSCTGTKVIALPPPIQNKLGDPRYIKLVIRGNTIVMKKSDEKRLVK